MSYHISFPIALMLATILLVIGIFIGRVKGLKPSASMPPVLSSDKTQSTLLYIDICCLLAYAQDIFATVFENEAKALQFIPEIAPVVIAVPEDKLEQLICSILTEAFLFHRQPKCWQLSCKVQDDRLHLLLNVSSHSIAEDFCIVLRQNRPFCALLSALKAHCLSEEGKVKFIFSACDKVINHSELALINEVMLEQSAKALWMADISSDYRLNTNLETIEDAQPHTRQLLLVTTDDRLIGWVRGQLAGHTQLLLASTPHDLLNCAAEQIPDVVLLCQTWLKANGLAVIEQLRGEMLTSHIPLLLIAQGDDPYAGSAVGKMLRQWQNGALEVHIEALLQQAKQGTLYWQQWLCEPHFEPSAVALSSSEQSVVAFQPSDHDFVERIENVLSAHIGDSRFDVTQLASLMHSSKRQLNRKMKGLVGMTPGEAIRHYRLKTAAQRLKQGEAPSVVTYDVGFTSHAYFSACFKARFGCPPSVYGGQMKRN